MAVDKKQRLVPGAMYIPPTPPVVGTTTTPSPSSALSTGSATKSPRASSSATSSSTTPSASSAKALNPNKPLGDLLHSLDPRSCFHPAVEELLLDMASDFVDNVVSFSARLAKHRRSTVLDARDLQLCLAKNYGISLAGATPIASASATDAATTPSASSLPLATLGADVVVRARPAKNSLHMHRIALKRKALQRTAGKLKKAKTTGTATGSGDGAAKKAVPRKSSTAGVPDTK